MHLLMQCTLYILRRVFVYVHTQAILISFVIEHIITSFIHQIFKELFRLSSILHFYLEARLSNQANTLLLKFICLLQHIIDWWSQTGSNRRPPACKAGALPAELWPHNISMIFQRTAELHRSLADHTL